MLRLNIKNKNNDKADGLLNIEVKTHEKCTTKNYLIRN